MSRDPSRGSAHSASLSLAGDETAPESLLEAAGVGIVVYRPDSTVERVDERVARFFGLSGEALVGVERKRVLEEYLRPCLDGPDEFGEFAGRSAADGVDGVDGVDCRVVGAEQREPRVLRCHSHPISDGRLAGGRIDQFVDVTPAGTDTGAPETTLDDTDSPDRRKALEESRNRYRTLVENFPNGAVTLVDEELRYATVGGTPLEDAESTPHELTGQRLADALPPELADLVLPHYRAVLGGGERRLFEATVGDAEYRFRIVPVRDDEGEVFAAMGMSQDVTERTRREAALEKRERILRELHAATRAFYPPQSTRDVSEFVVEFLRNALAFSYASVKLFDEGEGVLRPMARATSDDGLGDGVTQPGDGPIWNAYRTGDTRMVDRAALRTAGVDADADGGRALIVPIGDFGVIVAFPAADGSFDEVDVDLAEVVAANAQAGFHGLQSDRVRTSLAAELSEQQGRVADLRTIVDAIQRVQERVSSTETQAALDTGVCEELVELARVDFAWIGRPKTTETDLVPTASAGGRAEYLDSVRTGGEESVIPAQRAARTHERYEVANISQHVREQRWAKEALSAGFRSVLSAPLLYDDVLYGVLTIYSETEAAFTETYERLVTDVASLALNYGRMLERRRADARRQQTVLEFEFEDASYPLQQLAQRTDSEVRFEAVTEVSEAEVSVVATVGEGELGRLHEYAATATAIEELRTFGDPEHRQILVTVRKPFLVTDVTKHGGRIVDAVSDRTGTRIRIELLDSATRRPLFDFLASRYDDIDLVAQQAVTTEASAVGSLSTEILTERQYDILYAAYRGGYYETPRKITGQDLAESFDISSPAIYKHLQAAHKKLLDHVLGAVRITGDNGS
ncbi:GAF domain-containing protein [Halobellus sp. Atlit-31R]|nr:GAF domain-containing protein [Halobellus sp. Atlit-31R]